MSRPVIIKNGLKTVINVKDKDEKTMHFGHNYHLVFNDLKVYSFDVSADSPGGIVTHKGNPFGVVCIPSSVTGDQSIRILSIHNMSIKTPDDGSDSVDYNDTTDVVMFGPTYCPANWDVKPNFTGSFVFSDKNSSVNLNQLSFQDGFQNHKEWIRITDYYNRLANWRTNTPLGSYKPQGGSISYNSLTEPDPISTNKRTNRGYSEAAVCCWRYNPIKNLCNTQGYWYLPSFYELVYEAKNASSINQGLTTIKNTYNKGIGHLMNASNRNSTGNEGYFSSNYLYSSTQSYGGSAGKYHVGYDKNFTQWGACPPDPGMVQAWCKLIKVNGKWILDPAYHID